MARGRQRDGPWRPIPTAIIGSIGADKPLGYNLDMNFVIVPPSQPRVPVRITDYPAESDPGPFPVPANAPIENWPLAHNEDTGALPAPGSSLESIQRRGTGDRHLIIVDPGQRQPCTSSGRRGSPTAAGRRRRPRPSTCGRTACGP